jgi:arabinofuranan 3-O-arabinosyltransferase
MDGVDLGPPTAVDGYALGWWVHDLDAHEFTVEFGPQGPSDAAKVVSGAAALMTVVLLLRTGRPRATPARPLASAPARRRGPRRGGQGDRWRRRAGWLLFVTGCWFFAGPVGLVAGFAVAAWSLARSPRPSTLLRLSALAMGLVPIAWIVGNLSRWGEVSPQLVGENPAPSTLVVVALVLLLVGSWRDTDVEPT